ncbi:MAG: hypothetical protein DRJ03_04900 [Chloroflexi bacterium]|nr:MAG: hypothetical protein B6I35_00390 [Anaerolineaceae bacterium 4572_32.2]RLC81822.1 MAG: hypothetical protein DRI81_01440 [Chloroflexota bacterium]RLC87792.1 MAG: hypothetical protein DRJ03_04900 [Chloroflexota bacterium]HEY72556.1 hypothetical protein [Thermoflexia bacterium]
MGLGTCSIVELEPQDDFTSIQHRLGWLGRGRVALVLPWDVRFLSRELDFNLLRREAEQRQLEIAIISPDLERRALARGCGFPAFSSVEKAQETDVWRSRPPEQIEPPPHPWWEQKVELRPRPIHPRAAWLNWARLGTRLIIFVLALLIIAGSSYAIIPSGAVTLIPAGEEFTTIVPVSVDPDVEAIDHAAHLVPARRVGAEVEGYAEVETTGTVNAVAGRATGTAMFTNLLAQNYTVPAGTVVRTSSTSYPIRFHTTADVVVPAAGQATVPIEALDQNIGNVGAFQINQVEGVAASAVRVINPDPTSGAELQEVRAVTQADYDRAREQLMRQLLDQAYTDMTTSDLLEANEILLRQSLLIVGIPKEAYTHFITEQSDKVGLNMRLQVRGLAVDVDNAKAVAYAALSQSLPLRYELVDAHFELGEVAEEDVGPGWFTFFVTARGYAAAALDVSTAAGLIQGQRVAEAHELLRTEFPLAESPQITLWPEWPEQLKWLERLPLLPLRIGVQVAPQKTLKVSENL